MTQFNLDEPIDPITKSGATLASDLSTWRDAVHSTHIGSSAPSGGNYLRAGMMWVNNSATPWVLNMYDGADHIAMGTINPTTDEFIPGASPQDCFTSIKQAATTGATGVAELATLAEALAGVETDKICTPEGLASNQVLAQNGYTELPGGLIMQWGYNPYIYTATAITFPIPFPNNVFSVVTVPIGSVSGGGRGDYWGITNTTTTGFTQWSRYNGIHQFYWHALGN